MTHKRHPRKDDALTAANGQGINGQETAGKNCATGSASTQVHVLALVAGRLTCTVETRHDRVVIGITGAQPLGFELPKLRRWMAPIIVQFDDDDRAMEMRGVRSPAVYEVRTVDKATGAVRISWRQA